MFSLYLLLKFIHIAAAITAVGANITYGVWNARSQSEPAHLGFALKGIKFIDDRIANPAYGVLLLTGALMLAVGHWSITSLWVILALVLFAILVVVAVALYSPLLGKLIAVVDGGDTTSPEFSRLINRNRVLGAVLGLLVLLILVMMVFKPSL
ncbi:MAG TPA: DUF2269 family protein [Candidatus Dormibacteraeota bacterium]|nr:DUF2269 family protein [Candidatus Dormibacteraeota bacterium]